MSLCVIPADALPAMKRAGSASAGGGGWHGCARLRVCAASQMHVRVCVRGGGGRHGQHRQEIKESAWSCRFALLRRGPCFLPPATPGEGGAGGGGDGDSGGGGGGGPKGAGSTSQGEEERGGEGWKQVGGLEHTEAVVETDGSHSFRSFPP